MTTKILGIDPEFVSKVLAMAIAILLVYFIVRKWPGRDDRRFNAKFFGYFIAFIIILSGWELFIRTRMVEPEIVAETIEQLRVDPSIRRIIGSYNGHSYNENDIKGISQLPATIAFTIIGSKTDLRLLVIVDSSANIFEVKEYKIDSLMSK